MTARVIGSGLWDSNGAGVLMTRVFHPPTQEISASLLEHPTWRIGQIVDVRPRTWAGINRPGGTGRITKIHYSSPEEVCGHPTVEGLDVKYTVNSGHDLHLDPDLVKPHVELESRSRRRISSVQPVAGAENCEAVLNQRESKNKKASSTNKPTVYGAKKGSSSKKKISMTQRVFSGRKKRCGLRVHPIDSLKRTEVSPSSSIPREIFIKTIEPLSATNSECSHGLTSLDEYSPLGQNGVESRLIASSSYERTVWSQPQRPSVDTTNAECLSMVINEAQSHEDDMDLDGTQNILQLQMSPCAQQRRECFDALIRSTPLATGRYPEKRERRFSFEKFHVLSLIDPSVERKDGDSAEDDDDVILPRAKLSLRDIYDQERKKATCFIGNVVKGSSLPLAQKDRFSSKTLGSVNSSRLNEFRSLLNDYLHESDGMVQCVTLAEQLAQFSISSGNTVFDFTATEVDLYINHLCGQNKIMQTEGWIYNI